METEAGLPTLGDGDDNCLPPNSREAGARDGNVEEHGGMRDARRTEVEDIKSVRVEGSGAPAAQKAAATIWGVKGGEEPIKLLLPFEKAA